MLTLTCRHHGGETLGELLGGISGAWRSLCQSKKFREGVRGRGVEFVKALEVTTGHNPAAKFRSGWHPHFHVLLFIPEGIEAEVLDLLASEFPRMWAERVARRLDGLRPGDTGLHVTPLKSSAAAYLSKIGSEMTRSDTKNGGGREIGTVIDSLGHGESWALPVFSEFCQEMRGRPSLTWSRGLRARLLPDVDELTDEEAAQQEVVAEPVELVDIREWRRWLSETVDGVPLVVLELERIERDWLETRATSPP